MKTAVLRTVDATPWRRALERQLHGDVYHLPEYHRAAEANGDGEAFCYVAEDGPDVFLHPVLLRPVEDGLADLESVYGYSGPVSTTLEPGFLERAWSGFDAWCAERAVVAEFVRFNPLSENEHVATGRYEVEVARQSVILELHGSEAELAGGYPSVQRNMVRRARREGLEARELDSSGLEGLERLYHETMTRVGASSRYRFSTAYFRTLAAGLGSDLRLFGVYDGTRLVSAACFLLHGERMHYHLAGSGPEGRRAGANNLLLHEAALWGSSNGYRVLHLGGGVSGDPRDPLFRFKTSISTTTRPARVGRRVHDKPAYERLCAAWLEQRGLSERPPFFLLWRLDG